MFTVNLQTHAVIHSQVWRLERWCSIGAGVLKEYSSLFGFEFSLIRFEKLKGFRGFFPGDGRESNSTDIVRLSLAHERVVLEKVRFLRVIDISI